MAQRGHEQKSTGESSKESKLNLEVKVEPRTNMTRVLNKALVLEMVFSIRSLQNSLLIAFTSITNGPWSVGLTLQDQVQTSMYINTATIYQI